MRPVGHGQRVDAGAARHFHVVRGVADHQHMFHRCAQLFHDFLQHRRVGLGRRLVGAARRRKIRLQAGRLQRALQPAPALAGRDRQQTGLRQSLQQSFYAGKQPYRSVARQERPAIELYELGVALCRQAGDREPQRILQPEADDVARAAAVGHLEPELGACLLDAFDDGAGGIDQRAIPVEDDERIAHGCSTKARMSSGSFASNSTCSPLIGCANSSSRACRNSRRTPCFASAWLSEKSPYLSSPRIGCPAWARCTRIWCVRPVSRRTSRTLQSLPLFSALTRVTASRPPSPTLTRRSPFAETYLRSGARISSVVLSRTPFTTAT